MKLKLNFIRTLAFIVLIITIFQIKNTYAVFYSQMFGTAQANIGKWVIEVNNTNISTGVNNSFTISNLNLSSNSNVNSNKLAPGIVGSFDIIINPTNTNVSVRYDITVDDTNLSDNSIQISSIDEILDNTVDLIKTGKNTYTGVIPINKINGNYKNDVRINCAWLNDENNNDADSNIGMIKNNKLNIPITVSVSQYLGESITQYTGL
jgi:hypothetical protein